MSNDYEKEVTSSLGNRRTLILLACRADADIDYRNDKIASLEAQLKSHQDHYSAAEKTMESQGSEIARLNMKLNERDAIVRQVYKTGLDMPKCDDERYEDGFLDGINYFNREVSLIKAIADIPSPPITEKE